ncbi:MAG: helix-turn-helix domain-containing protein [Betaproteobacteria bacterium]
MAESSTQPVFTLLTSPAELGMAIRQARGAMGLSLREAAERAGVGKRFVLELEQGKPSARLDKVLTLMAAVNLLAIIVPLEEAMAALGPKR